jgi:Bacteriophage head to tail connecting protein
LATDSELEEKFARHDRMKSERAREEGTWRELARILRPGEQEFQASEYRDPDGTDTWDSTPLYAQDDFVSGLFSEGTNPAMRWFEFEIGEAGDRELMKFTPVKQWLWDVASDVQATLMPQVSAFYTEVPAWFADMATYGDGTLYQEEMIGYGLVDRAVAKGRVFFERNVAGYIDTVHNEIPLTGRQVKQRWPNAPESVRKDDKYTVLHCVYPNEDYDPRYIGANSMAFESYFVCREIRGWSVEGGYHELPYHVIEWDRRSGRTYGRGPGHNALADMHTLDEMERSNLTALQFEAEPMWLTSDDSIMSAADIMPGAVIAGGLSENAKERAMAASRGENLAYPLAAAEAKRNMIRRAFRFSMWQLAQKPMTATEWTGWKEEEIRAAAPHMVRVQRGLSQFISRRYALLARARRLRPAPPELGGQPIHIEFTSPFAKALKLTRARGAMQLGTTAASLQQTFPDIADNLNGDEIIRTIHDGLSGEPTLIRDPRQVEQIRQMRAQQQQQQAQIEQAAIAAKTYAEVSHADQANTLAAGRKPQRAA